MAAAKRLRVVRPSERKVANLTEMSSEQLTTLMESKLSEAKLMFTRGERIFEEVFTIQKVLRSKASQCV